MLKSIKKEIWYKFKKKPFWSLEHFVDIFFKEDCHQWILKKKNVERSFRILFSSLPISTINFFENKKLLCLKLSGEKASTLSPPTNAEIILIFPDLLKLLNSGAYLEGVSILAHEFGHIVNLHSKIIINPIRAQIDADTYVHDIGFGQELLKQLTSYPENYEYNLRIKHLESYFTYP